MENLNMYINGEWIPAKQGDSRQILNPANGKVIATVTEGDAADAKYAIKVARQAFDDGQWPRFEPKKRARYLSSIADAVEKEMDDIARLETMNNGKLFKSSQLDVLYTVDCFRYYASLLSAPEGQVYNLGQSFHTMVVREPIGVCGLIVPWNFPLLMAAWQIAPALAAGNTIVFKPSEMTPLTAGKLFEIIERVGIPAGTANLVLGKGSTVGNEIAINRSVDKIAFTGGTATGKTIMHAAVENVKKFSMELGGKSPNIVFADVDLDIAVDNALFALFLTQGQVCSAGSRLLLDEKIHDEFVARLVKRAQRISVGAGDNPTSEMGPLISEGHLKKVLNYIEIGQQEGATLACGGHRLMKDGLEKGFFVEPTVFVDTTPEMRIIQEEIFGPVLVVQKFKNEEEAIALANGTPYGLAGAVFTNDMEKATRVIKRLRAGITWVNCYHVALTEAPWGGYKQSGFGRGLGAAGLEEFTELKQINVCFRAQPVGWFKS